MKSILAGLPFVILFILLSHIRFVNALKLPAICTDKLPSKYHRKQIVCLQTSREISFEVKFNHYLKNQSLPMPMPKNPTEAKYVEFNLNQFQAKVTLERQAALAEQERKEAEEVRKAKEKSDLRWTRAVILAALILGCSISIPIYYGAVNFGAAVITPKFKDQVTASINELIKVVSEFSIFRLPFKIKWPFGRPK